MDNQNSEVMWKTKPQIKDDPVNHPRHYTNSQAVCSRCGTGIECIDISRFYCFSLGNVIKYIWRHDDKAGIEDLKKARWYLDDEIKQREKQLEQKGIR